ncbi:MAG: glycosyltransferase family 4 protein [Acidobacteria bacterium]|nr:glycosyltransferase family 4 protein [Acidobacteriota bacterium]
MSIIHLIAQLRFGAGRYVVDTAIEQARGLKHYVAVCVSPDADAYWRTDPKLVSELDAHGIRIRTVGDFFQRKAFQIHRAASTIAELKKDAVGPFIVHAHTAMAAAAGYWVKPDVLVASCHGWGTSRPSEMDLQDSLAYQLCDSVVTYSSYWAERLKNDLAVSNPQVLSIGLNINRYPMGEKKCSAKQEPFRIVTACELTPRKGVDLLLKAMPLLWEQMPDTELHIMGDGDAVEDLHHLAYQVDPGTKKVFFHGSVPNPFDRLADFDLFALSSRSDNMPVIVLEAMLAGLPIVATAVGGIPELISTAECGTVVAPESAPALAQGIMAQLKTDRKSMIRRGSQGERFVRQRLDVKNTAAELDTIYRKARKNRVFVQR